MSSTATPALPALPSATAPGARRGRRPGLSRSASLVLLASIVVTFLAASAAPTPLYAVYQEEWGFSPITTTVVFGAYAVAVLVALLTLGRLSDHLGRRPVLLAALTGQVGSMVLFTTAGGVPELLAARVIQGIATGAALGAIGAAMLDLDRARGTLANAVAPGIGTASGALVSGLVVQFLPAPTHLVYLAAVVLFTLQGGAVLLMRETVTRTPGALATLRPDVRLPRAVRPAVLAAAPVLFAVWALAGLYGSLGPALVRQLTGSTSLALGGLSLFVLAGVAALSVVLLRNTTPRAVMTAGIATLIAGVGLTLVALATRSVGLFFAATAVAGLGFGSGFQGGIRTVVPLTEPHERAGVLSVLYTVSYLGLGVPAVAAGWLVVHGSGLLATAREYGVAVAALAAFALLAMTVRRTTATPAATPAATPHGSTTAAAVCPPRHRATACPSAG